MIVIVLFQTEECDGVVVECFLSWHHSRIFFVHDCLDSWHVGHISGHNWAFFAYLVWSCWVKVTCRLWALKLYFLCVYVCACVYVCMCMCPNLSLLLNDICLCYFCAHMTGLCVCSVYFWVPYWTVLIVFLCYKKVVLEVPFHEMRWKPSVPVIIIGAFTSHSSSEKKEKIKLLAQLVLSKI